MMTFEEAAEIVKTYGLDAGRDGSLLDGMEAIRDELSYCEADEDAPSFVTQKQIAAYRIVYRGMRKLFYGDN